jgi:cobalt-zinc-cadmium resistance protein CzcA
MKGDRRTPIVVRLPESIRGDVEALRNLMIPIAADAGIPRAVPLREIAAVDVRVGPNQINREDGKRRVVVTVNVTERDLGVVHRRGKVRGSRRSGTARRLLDRLRRDFRAAQFRDAALVDRGASHLAADPRYCSSWRLDPAGIPSSCSLACRLRSPAASLHCSYAICLCRFRRVSGSSRSPVSPSSTASSMISFIRELRVAGRPLAAAIREGAITRLRPVLMTALVASLGFVPMALSIGAGAEVQRPLATVVIGGVISSTLLTLFVLPALYSLLHRADESRDVVLRG